jgi:hypothetical protein
MSFLQQSFIAQHESFLLGSGCGFWARAAAETDSIIPQAAAINID